MKVPVLPTSFKRADIMSKKTIARFSTVRWVRMQDELVDSDEQAYEIYLAEGRLLVSTPEAAALPLLTFLEREQAGRRIRYLYRRLGHKRLTALNGAILDFYPKGSERDGLPSIGIEGGELNGRQF